MAASASTGSDVNLEYVYDFEVNIKLFADIYPRVSTRYLRDTTAHGYNNIHPISPSIQLDPKYSPTDFNIVVIY